MSRQPVYCGHSRGNTCCVALAVAVISGRAAKTTACQTHLGWAQKFAGPGYRIETVVQPDGAVAGDGQGTLFEIGGTP